MKTVRFAVAESLIQMKPMLHLLTLPITPHTHKHTQSFSPDEGGVLFIKAIRKRQQGCQWTPGEHEVA